MRKLFLIVLFVFVAGSITAQDEAETLLQGDIDHGGFGGPVVKFSQVYDNSAVLVGGRGGWIIDHVISIGGGGYGVVSRIETAPNQILEMGYGGFEMEFIVSSDRLIHATICILAGAGGTTVHADGFDPDEELEGDAFFVLEPAVNAELNITGFFRVTAGIGYRYVSGVEKFNLSDSDIGGLAGSLTFKFGSF